MYTIYSIISRTINTLAQYLSLLPLVIIIFTTLVGLIITQLINQLNTHLTVPPPVRVFVGYVLLGDMTIVAQHAVNGAFNLAITLLIFKYRGGKKEEEKKEE